MDRINNSNAMPNSLKALLALTPTIFSSTSPLSLKIGNWSDSQDCLFVYSKFIYVENKAQHKWISRKCNLISYVRFIRTSKKALEHCSGERNNHGTWLIHNSINSVNSHWNNQEIRNLWTRCSGENWKKELLAVVLNTEHSCW